MDVTRKNFKFALEHLRNSLKTAAFFAVDLELSGLPGKKKGRFNNARVTYDFYKENLRDIKAIQVGVSLFEPHRDTNTYKSSTYTFHLAPQEFISVEQKIEWQAGAMQFLIKHKIDINKNFYEGVPYLNEIEEEILTNDLKKNALDIPQDIQTRHLYQKEFISIEKFIESPETTLKIPCSPIMFYLLFSYIENNHPKLQINNTDLLEIILTKDSESEPSKIDCRKEIVNFCSGFTTVINILSASLKPLIIHNGLLDLIVIHNQFMKPLPNKYEEFKMNINKKFSSVFDTKLIANDLKFLVKKEQFTGTSLQELYEFFDNFQKSSGLCIYSPKIKLNEGFDSTIKFHEAGWDSYCTGYVFVRLCHWAACTQSGKDKIHTFSQHRSAIDKFSNQISIAVSTTPYICLDKSDPPVFVPGCIHIESRGNPTIDMGKIANLLSEYHSINIRKHGKNCALVTVGRGLNANVVLKSLEKEKELKAATYNFIRHAHGKKLALWSTLVLTTGSLATLAIAYLKP